MKQFNYAKRDSCTNTHISSWICSLLHYLQRCYGFDIVRLAIWLGICRLSSPFLFLSRLPPVPFSDALLSKGEREKLSNVVPPILEESPPGLFPRRIVLEATCFHIGTMSPKKAASPQYQNGKERLFRGIGIFGIASLRLWNRGRAVTIDPSSYGPQNRASARHWRRSLTR